MSPPSHARASPHASERPREGPGRRVLPASLLRRPEQLPSSRREGRSGARCRAGPRCRACCGRAPSIERCVGVPRARVRNIVWCCSMKTGTCHDHDVILIAVKSRQALVECNARGETPWVEGGRESGARWRDAGEGGRAGCPCGAAARALGCAHCSQDRVRLSSRVQRPRLQPVQQLLASETSGGRLRPVQHGIADAARQSGAPQTKA